MKIIFTKKQLILKKKIINNFQINLLYQLVMEYLDLKKKDENKEENKYIIEQFDLLIDFLDDIDKTLTSAEVPLKSKIESELPLDLIEMNNFLEKNPYYKPIFQSWIFFLSINSNKKLQNECFNDIYNETKKHLQKNAATTKNKTSVEKKVLNRVNKKYEEKIDINDYSIFNKYSPNLNFKYLRK